MKVEDVSAELSNIRDKVLQINIYTEDEGIYELVTHVIARIDVLDYFIKESVKYKGE